MNSYSIHFTNKLYVSFILFSCIWNQKPCDLDHDFVTTITDVGVCYTFNSGINQSARVVTEHGKTTSMKYGDNKMKNGGGVMGWRLGNLGS